MKAKFTQLMAAVASTLGVKNNSAEGSATPTTPTGEAEGSAEGEGSEGEGEGSEGEGEGSEGEGSEGEGSEGEGSEGEGAEATAAPGMLAIFEAMGALGARVDSLENDFDARVSAAAGKKAVSITASQGVPVKDLPAGSKQPAVGEPSSIGEFMEMHGKIAEPKASAAFYKKHSAKFLGAGN